MSENGNGSMSGANGRPHALLRAGYPFYTTLGMRRVTTYPMDLVIGEEDRLYVLNRTDGQGGQIRRINWDDDDLDIFGSDFVWPVQMIGDDDENVYVSDEGKHTITVWRPSDGELLDEWGHAWQRPRSARPTIRHLLGQRRQHARRGHAQPPRPEVHVVRSVHQRIWRVWH